MMKEPFEYNFSETEQYKGHRCPPQAVKGEDAHEVGLLDDNMPLDTETPKPEAEEETENEEPQEPVVEPQEPVIEPQEPVTEPEDPVVEPQEPVTEPTEPEIGG